MASERELRWWNEFSDIMAKHWRLTPYLDEVIRGESTSDYNGFLLKKGGKLLELGCGTGWLGHYFAKNGMAVDGLDFSEEQLRTARMIAGREGVDNIEFFRRDVVHDPLTGRFNEYDSVMINAVLHHLSSEQIPVVMRKVSSLLGQSGRVYVYEPLVPKRDNVFKFAVLNAIDLSVGLLFVVLKKLPAVITTLSDDEFKGAYAKGYTGASPDERPIDFHWLAANCEASDLELVEVTPYHHYGIGYGMIIMRFAHPYREPLSRLAAHFQKLDQYLFRRFGWQNFSTWRSHSVLCGMMFRRRTVSPVTTNAI